MDPTYPPRAAGTGAASTGSVSGSKKLDMLLRLARGAGGGPDRIEPRPGRGPAPLSFGQERLWLLNQIDPSAAAYNVTAAFRLARLDVRALERAVEATVRRHDSLRTVFRQVDGAAVQVTEPFACFSLPVEDLSALDADAREAAVARRAAEERARPYDLAAGPLFRPRLLRLGAEDVLMLNLHHVVSDGWSMGILFRELAELYAAFAAGREAALPALPVQYADYAVWQRRRLQGEALERHLAYWRERMADAPALLELPTDHPRPAVQTYRGARESLDLPAGLADRLRALARGEEATLFMVLLAAFQAVLGKYAGTDDVVVGTPVAGRGIKETEGLVGFFVNTLVLRTRLGGDPGFRQLLRRVRETTLGAFEHEELPFERLVAELQPGRTLSHAPLFQVMFTTEAAPRPDAGAPAGGGTGLVVRGVEVESATAQFDLTLTVYEAAGGLHATFVYSTDLFERETVARMLVHLRHVLEQVAADPDVRLSRLHLADGDERARVVTEWNRTERPYPRGVCIHDVFHAQVRARPDAEALAWGGARWTYAELDARANQLAHGLRRHGVGPESRVGVLLERGPELVVSILGILKAGGCYVPLDPAYPAERLRMMLADAGARVLLTRSELREAVAETGLHVIALDEAADALAGEPVDAPRGGATAESLAYIVYTSGSTGRPKGVMVGHREVVQLVCETDFVRLGPGDRVAQASNASFDALAFEAWGALLNGATLVGIGRDVLLSPPALHTFLREQRITTLYQTTALLNQLSREQPDIFASLREVLFGGQAVDADSVRRLLKAGKPERLLHVYGPTETTAWCSYHDVRQVDEGALTVSVGVPIGNARIYVLDPHLFPTPAGVPGEAYVGGAGVVRGYLDRPALTAERFVPDPFALEPGARMYRTGDRLRWKMDGTLEFISRLDAQVKIRGFRIEPGEVESVLAAHADVREARVIVREDEPGEKRLVAYVVGGTDADGLRAHLRHTLPEYMVPAAFVVIDRLPLTPTGKLDVRALPAPDLAGAADRHVPPRTPAEEVLAGIWGAVLRLDRIGATDNFFDLGGHSLLAVAVVSRVREVFGVELPLRAVFETPTVGELAARVDALRCEGAPLLPPVVPADRTAPLPLSFAQERLWFLDRLQPGMALYNSSAALRLIGALDAALLERALGEVVRRHEVLRTTFAEHGGAPVQTIAPFAGFVLPVEDLGGLEAAEAEAAVRARVADAVSRPFDLPAGPLFAPALLRLADDEHVLLLRMHHVITDGWSMGVLVRELTALYAAFRDGGDPSLPALPVQYADYAVWQRAQLEGAALDGQLAYWRDQLAGAPELLELPTDRPRPAVQAFRGARVPVVLPGELLERLQALGRGEGATLYMVVLAAFQALLSRMAGTEDVVVGSPIAGRGRRETEGLIGFFVNTLVLRGDLSGDPGFRALLGRVRDVTLGAYEHQDVPFERLVAELQPERSLAHAPLFQVMFTLQTADAPAGGVDGLRIRPVGTAPETARFDLALDLAADPSGIRGALEYRTDLFDPATAERMVQRLAAVLEQVAADPERRLSALELMDDGERRALHAWSGTETPYPPRALHALFAEQAARTPDAPALVFDGRTVAYAELDAAANRLAQHLIRCGAAPETVVGVVAERTPETAIALLAVLKAGAAYLPLDPSYPADRLRYMLADSGARLIVSHGALPAGLDAGRLADADLPRVVDPMLDAERIAACPAVAPSVPADAESLAYVIYTSGSTGRPKGVAVPHRGVPNLASWKATRLGQRADDRALQFASLSFDAAVEELFGAWLIGGTLVMAPREALMPGEPLRETLRRERITFATLPPSVLAMLDPADFPDLRVVVSAGEALPASVAARWADAVELHNAYGPTETTVSAASGRVMPGRVTADGGAVNGDAADGIAPDIGRPLENVRAAVLDGAGRLVPPGVPGELYIGGAGVARGYLGRPALTAERFVPDAYGERPGARWYRTGDRVRWTREGTLQYLGRMDAQVKVRGFRIEPGEVERVLLAHPGVREARVLVRQDAPGEKRLVAYVAGEVDGDALRAHLRGSLPEYMVPGAFVVLDALPRTPNGKLDVRALPVPDFMASANTYVEPRTPLEETVAGIWGEVLRVDRVGAADRFFDLGGHSLLAARVVSRIRQVLGVEMPLRTLFQGLTVAEVADAVDALRRTDGPVAPPVVPVPRDEPLPLSFAQERLWFLDRLQPGSAFYNLASALRLSGALDAPALERALGEVVRRHEALRTTFAQAGGAPVQTIAPYAGFALPIEDLSALDADAREGAVTRRASEEAARAFDLAAGPLFRAVLLRVDRDDHVLLVAMHHAVSDGWSMNVLVRELSALYGAYADGWDAALPDLPVQYADYAVWQRAQLSGDALERQLAYWRERLGGAPELLDLPTDHPRPAVQAFRGAQVPVAFSGGLLERLKRLGQREGATLYMVLLGAFQVLLAKYAGTEDVVVGSPVAGRNRAETEGLIGFFVNTLVLRTGLQGDPHFREVLRRVRDVTLGAYEHQEIPFEKLVAELHPERSLGHAPLFQVMFSLNQAEPARAPLPGLRVQGMGVEQHATKFDLTLGLSVHAEGIGGTLEYSTALFDRATMERMLGHLGRILEQVADDADLPLSRLEMLGADERARVVDAWNRTDAPYPADTCIHQLFEAQAVRTPDAVAAVHGHDALTYAQLNARANRLAHHLIGLGAGPEVRVGICLHRGLDLLVAMLAVLKAGGAYVPLDPAYPIERLENTLADASAPILVTQERLRALLPDQLGVSAVVIDRDHAIIGRESAENPRSGVRAGNLAYLIYTSGSTGRPKGVAIQHESAVVMLAWALDTYGADELGGMLASTSISFDMSVFEMFAPLARGGRVIIVENALALPTAPAANDVRLLDTVPSAAAALLKTGGIPASVRTVNLGGEPLKAELVDALYAHGVERVYDLYGPSEDTTFSTCALRRPGGPVTIGRILSNSRAYVLDAALRPVPVGIPGELYIGGRGVTRGYLGRPALTAERYVPDNIGGTPGARLYRTGDRIRWNADGTLQYLGRLDEQVKIRGFRVELGEVESVLRRAGATDCVVVARGDAGGTRLVAYVVGEVDADTLRAAVRRTLPDYMVPAAFVGLEALPLTPNGKLDRRALPAPPPAAAADGRRLRPETELEARIAAIWQELLGMEAVGVEDSFFDLGGHSLLLVQLQGRLGEDLGRAVPLVELLQYTTVRTLAAWLQGQPQAQDGAVDEGEERGGARQAALGRRLQARRRRDA